MHLPDSDTLVILGISSVWIVAVVLDWFGVEWGDPPKEPRGFEVCGKRRP